MRWAECMVMMSLKHFAKVVEVMVPKSDVQALGLGQYGHKENVLKLIMHDFFLYFNSCRN